MGRNNPKNQFSAELYYARRNPLYSPADRPESGRVDGRIDGLRIRIVVVEQIEHFRPKFEGAGFAEMEGFSGGKIYIHQARQAERVRPRGGTESPKLGRGESRGVEPLLPTPLIGIQIATLSEQRNLAGR